MIRNLRFPSTTTTSSRGRSPSVRPSSRYRFSPSLSRTGRNPFQSTSAASFTLMPCAASLSSLNSMSNCAGSKRVQLTTGGFYRGDQSRFTECFFFARSRTAARISAIETVRRLASRCSIPRPRSMGGGSSGSIRSSVGFRLCDFIAAINDTKNGLRGDAEEARNFFLRAPA